MPIKRKGKTKFKVASVEEHRQGLSCPEHVVFCLRYLTANKSHNFKYYGGKQRNDEDNTKSSLYAKLEELGCQNWKEFLAKRKETGLETIPIQRLNFTPHPDLKISKDEKFISIRFSEQNMRIIGIKRSCCPILHIIGYDFDFSAYDH